MTCARAVRSRQRRANASHAASVPPTPCSAGCSSAMSSAKNAASAGFRSLDHQPVIGALHGGRRGAAVVQRCEIDALVGAPAGGASRRARPREGATPRLRCAQAQARKRRENRRDRRGERSAWSCAVVTVRRFDGATILPHEMRAAGAKEDAMVSLVTPAGQLGMLAPAFDLPGVDGRRHTLASARGANGVVVMFICNHCPYVKAVIDKIVRDTTELAPHGVGAIAISSNDPADYPDDSFDNMKAFAARHGMTIPVRLRRNAGRRESLRRRLHAGLLRLRPRPDARLPRPPRQLRALARPGRAARAVSRDGRDRAYRQGTRDAARVGRLLDQVARRVRKATSASSTASGSSAIIEWPQPGSVIDLHVRQRVGELLRGARRRHDVAGAEDQQRRAAHARARRPVRRA